MKRTILSATFLACLGIAGAQYYNVPGFPSGGVGLSLVDSKLTIRDGRREVVITTKELIDALSERFPVTTYPEVKTIPVSDGSGTINDNAVCLASDGSFMECK